MTIEKLYTYISEILLASVFAFGLVISNMTKPSATLAFLDVTYPWYPILVLVLGAGLIIAVPSFYLVDQWNQPIVCSEFSRPTQSPFDLDYKLIIGEIAFGIGWGLTGKYKIITSNKSNKFHS